MSSDRIQNKLVIIVCQICMLASVHFSQQNQFDDPIVFQGFDWLFELVKPRIYEIEFRYVIAFNIKSQHVSLMNSLCFLQYVK